MACAAPAYVAPTKCRRGGCGACRTHLVDGEVSYSHPVADSVLSNDDVDAGLCLPCRARPTTDVVIDLGTCDRLWSSWRPSTAPPTSTTGNESAMSVIRLGYVHLRVTDLAEARKHYEETLGMDAVHVEGNRVRPQVLGRGRPPLGRNRGRRRRSAGKIGYKVYGERALDEIEAKLPAFGVTYERMSKGEFIRRRRGVAHHIAVRPRPRALLRHRVPRHPRWESNPDRGPATFAVSAYRG